MAFEINQLIGLASIGLAGGLLGGLLGIGGAIVVIPALVILMGYSQQMAQGTTLMMMVPPVGALAAWQYYKQGYVDIKSALFIAAFFLIGGFFGARLALHLPQQVLKRIFAILLLVLSAKMLFFDKQ